MTRKLFCGVAFVLCMSVLISCGGDKDTDTDSAVDTNTDTDTSSDTATNSDLKDCATMCELATGCDSLPSQDVVFGSTQAECEERCSSSMEWYMAQCTRSASTCDDLSECTRPTNVGDADVCDSACELVVNECGLASDLGQCGIDCYMVIGYMGSDYFGAGVQCWQKAVDEGDCAIAEQCPVMYF